MTELRLPHAIEVERFLLGSMLSRPGLMDDMRSTLIDSDFSLESHRKIWRRACELYDVGTSVDLVTVSHAIETHHERESVGGFSYLADLTANVPAVPIESHLNILRDKALRRRLVHEANRLALLASQDHQPIDELLTAASNLAGSAVDRTGEPKLLSTADLIAAEGIDKLLGRRSNSTGVRLPWPKVQTALDGFSPAQLIVLLGETSRGKTSFALQCVSACASQGSGVLIWTLEMSPRGLFRRLANQISGITLSGRPMQLTLEERTAQREAVALLNNQPIWFDRSSRTVSALCGSVRKLRARFHLGLIVVDYLQLIGAHSRTQSRAQEVGENSRNLKLAAIDFEVPILALSQVDRTSVKGGGKIGLHSAKESGDIESDSDVLMWIEAGEFSTDKATDVKLHIGKQREGPAGFWIAMRFQPQSQTFVEA